MPRLQSLQDTIDVAIDQHVTLAALFDTYRADVYHLDSRISDVNGLLTRLYQKRESLDDQLANDLDKLYPGWRDLVKEDE